MPTIYQAQMDAFTAAAVRDFEERMVKHLQRFFPRDCRSLGEEGVRETIGHGVARAAGYGVKSEHDVALYLNLMMALGRDFDRDPLLPWARAVLVDATLPEPSRRMQRLYRRTLERTKAEGVDEHGE